MSYSGNPSLGVETQDRIVTTYNQSLDLAAKGRGQEAELGCGFILKLDPLFSPATELQQLLQSGGDLSGLQALPLPSQAGQTAQTPEPVPAAPEAAQPIEVEAVPMAAPGPAPGADPLAAEINEVMGLGEPTDPMPMAEPVMSAGEPGDPPMPLVEAVAEPVAEIPMAEAVVEPVLEVVAEASPAAPDGDGDDRIGELLAEGQASFASGNYQAAIDAWSRIFLIDIDHAEATKRIDEARTLMDEAERKVEEIFAEASEHRAAGRNDEARAGFERVLEVDPDHLAAREAIDRIDSGEPDLMPEDDFAVPDVEGELNDLESAEGVFDPDAPLPDGAGSDLKAPAPGKKGAGKGRFRLIAAVVALLLGVGGYFLWSNKDQLFPNSDNTEQADRGKKKKPPKSDPVEAAVTLWENGEQEMALGHLERVERDHPEYARAKKQLAEWKAELEAELDDPPPEDDGVSDEVRLAERDALVEQARSLYNQNRYFEAAKRFRAANRIATLDGTAADLYDDSRRQLVPIKQQIDLFMQGDWERLVPVLWRMRQEDETNRDVERLLVDSYFNLGVRDLRRGRVDVALENFNEAAKLRSDPTVERVVELCKGYDGRRRDTLFDIFVEQIGYRR